MAEQNKNDDYKNENDKNIDTNSMPSDEVPTIPSANSGVVVETDRITPPITPRSTEVTPQATANVVTAFKSRFIDIKSPPTPESPGAILDPSRRINAIRDASGAISLQLLLQRIRWGNTIGNSSGADLNEVPKTPPGWIHLDLKHTPKSLEGATSVAMAAQEKDAARLKTLLESRTTLIPLPQINSSTSASDEDDVENPPKKE